MGQEKVPEVPEVKGKLTEKRKKIEKGEFKGHMGTKNVIRAKETLENLEKKA